LRELALWGWGPMLLLAAITGVAVAGRRLAIRWRRWLAGRWNNSSVLLLILLAWLVPMSFRLSTLHVKYLRYWEPLLVPAVLVAAWWLCRLQRRFLRRAITAVVAGTVLWGVAYLWAFATPHPHRTASEWLAPLLEDGQVVAFETWDETISLEAEGTVVERISLPSYDLPDDEAKALRWARELDRADWVVMTSNRVLRTVLANPQRFPLTARLYRLLVDGEAGFELLTRVHRGPRIFGLEWPVQSADESFVNYDFPQVLIFRRVAEVPPEELVDLVQRPLPYLDELGFAGLERSLIEPVPSAPWVPSGTRQVIDLAVWMLVFSSLGLATWVLLMPLLKTLPDAGVGLALTTGWILPAWLLWLGSELRIWAIGPTTATWVFLALVSGAAVRATRARHTILSTFRRRRGAIIKVLVVTATVGIFFLVVRAFNPAIYWGEKPMDFAFLNAFLRSPAWPPGEPWMAGMPLHYYYFGEVLAAFPILVAGCSAGVGYNLIAAAIPAFGAAVLASFGLVLARRRRWFAATLLPVLILATGNLAWPWLLDIAHGGKFFDLWWATSRVVPGFAIDEYPLWTALFADLHGHFIALPVLLATLYWGWVTVRARGREWVGAAGLCGLGAAVVAATNPWDLFLLTATLAVGVVVAARRPLVGLGRLAAAGALSLAASFPFVVELVAGINAGAGGRGLFLTDADFAPAWAVLRHFGLFLAPLAALAFATLGRRWWLALPAAGLGVLGGLTFNSTAAALGLAAAAVFGIVAFSRRHRFERFAWALATLGSLAIAACERFTLIDRMNTLFKIYNGVWVVFALALAALLLRTRGGQRRLLFAVWVPLQILAAVNLPLGVAQGWLQPRISSPRPSLDGQAFLATRDRQTWFLVHALQGVARPGDVVAESAGASYGQHARIVMHTGQPTVVGWEWHLRQRGQSLQEIGARFEDLQTLYAGRDQLARRAVLDRYDVRWVVLSDLERQQYDLHGDDPLHGVPGLLRIAERDGAALYAVTDDGASQRPVAPAMELPKGAAIIGALPENPRAVVRSLALDGTGALVTLRDGQVIVLDLAGRRVETVSAPPCDVVSAARWRGDLWSLCSDGRTLRLENAAWRPDGRIAGGVGLTADTGLWVWGDGGVWRRNGDTWQKVFSGVVTAAAARGEWLAWSDGRTVLVGRDGVPATVAGTLDGVYSLAWLGVDVVAVDTQGIHRSGGGLLPWRSILPGVGEIAAISGRDHNLWLIRSDGLIVESVATRCASPWRSEPGSTGAGLREPRGLAVSPDGWFAVADTQNHRVRWFNIQGDCLDEFGSEGTAPGNFREPSGLALAANGTLAVTDTWNGRVQLVQPDGGVETFGSNLFGPRDALWAADGSLFVADTGNRRLLRFDPPNWQETVVATLPGPVTGLATVSGLVAAAVPVDGAVLLVDPRSGAVVRRLDVPGWSSGEQQEAYLALLPSGDLAATAPRTGEVWRVDPTGRNPARLLRDGLPGVTAVALLPDGELLVSLTWEHRLEKIAIVD
jgi:YYY domain-containing protein